MTELVAVFGRGRQPAKRYVEPPELRAGVVVLTDGQVWRVVGLNAGNGSVPAAPGAAALTGEHLAETFRDSWSRAREGKAAVTTLTEWIRSIDTHPDRDLTERWREFFLRGGQVFKVSARPGEGILAQRFVWYWPLTGQDPVRPSLNRADQIDVLEAARWRALVEDQHAWGAAPEWETAAAWMRDRALVNPRASAWWIADTEGRPSLAVDETDVLAEVRGWWAGGGSAFGSAIVERYGLPVPSPASFSKLARETGHLVSKLARETTRRFWYGWLRWDPFGSPREDGLATVLGLHRVGEGIEVLWWDIGEDGRPHRPSRAQPQGGGPVSIDLVEQLCASVAATERRWSDVDWVEVEPA